MWSEGMRGGCVWSEGMQGGCVCGGMQGECVLM